MILIAIDNYNLDALFKQRFQMAISLILPFILYILNVILQKEEPSIIKCLLSERQDKLMIF